MAASYTRNTEQHRQHTEVTRNAMTSRKSTRHSPVRGRKSESRRRGQAMERALMKTESSQSVAVVTSSDVIRALTRTHTHARAHIHRLQYTIAQSQSLVRKQNKKREKKKTFFSLFFSSSLEILPGRNQPREATTYGEETNRGTAVVLMLRYGATQ